MVESFPFFSYSSFLFLLLFFFFFLLFLLRFLPLSSHILPSFSSLSVSFPSSSRILDPLSSPCFLLFLFHFLLRNPPLFSFIFLLLPILYFVSSFSVILTYSTCLYFHFVPHPSSPFPSPPIAPPPSLSCLSPLLLAPPQVNFLQFCSHCKEGKFTNEKSRGERA